MADLEERRRAFLRAIGGQACGQGDAALPGGARRRNDRWPALGGFDRAARVATGASRLCGVDEAGRGPLAGPVVAAAVILKPGAILAGLDDSKKLSAKARLELFPAVLENAEAVAVGLVGARTIDAVNILQASFLAMRRAWQRLGRKPDFTLVDGNREVPSLGAPQAAIVDGDAKSACVAAASIIAKVYRDHLMGLAARLYPEYGFAVHKGYGTPEHREMLRLYGPCPLHRLTFVDHFLEKGGTTAP